jgi:hypothetical protein
LVHKRTLVRIPYAFGFPLINPEDGRFDGRIDLKILYLDFTAKHCNPILGITNTSMGGAGGGRDSGRGFSTD